MMLRSLCAAVLITCPAAAAAQEAMFVLRAGNDTISLEKFSRKADRLTSELLIKPASARIRFDLEIRPDGTTPKLVNTFWMATDAADAEPRQTAVFNMIGDSAIVDLSGGGQKQTQRLGTTAGAIPYVNPSFSLVELLIQRARGQGAAGGEVPVLMVAGGQTLSVKVQAVGTDSVSVNMGGSEMRVRVDPQGRILGGRIPAQNATIERAGGGAASLEVEKPDYSAPAGAPYTATDLTIPTTMGHTLAGTLTLPAGASRSAPVPAVVTITGSGGQDRDEAISMFKGFRPFRELADSLGRRGIAVLRMDDRGVGGSGGNAAIATSADFAKDIEAGLAYLRTRPEIDSRRLGLIGHSEGGIIAPMVAERNPSLAGIVLLAGTAYTGRQVLTFQLNNHINNDTSLTKAGRDSALGKVAAQIDSIAATSPWFDFFFRYDPAATARRVKTPVLILNGATDQQVTPDQVPILEKAFKAAGNKDVTAKVLPDLNHLFVHDPDGYPGRYTQLKSFAVDRQTIGIVVDWLAKRLIKPAT